MSTKIMWLFLLLGAALLSSCASTGVVPDQVHTTATQGAAATPQHHLGHADLI